MLIVYGSSQLKNVGFAVRFRNLNQTSSNQKTNNQIVIKSGWHSLIYLLTTDT